MSTTYTANPTATQAPAAQPGPGVLPIATLPADGEGATIASLAQQIKAAYDYIGWLMQSGGGGRTFGDGSFGDHTYAADADLAAVFGTVTGQPVFFNNLTINAGIHLYAKGAIIYVKNTLTIASGGRLLPDVQATMAGVGAGTPGVCSIALTALGTYPFRAGGGGDVVLAAGGMLNSVGGNGGGGGAGTVSAGLPGGAVTPSVETFRKYLFNDGWAGGQAAWAPFSGGGGGGSGGSGSTGASAGCGGAGGAPLIVLARRIVTADANAIQSCGGVGSNGGASGGGFGGGGGGGGGGFVGVVYGTHSGPAFDVTASVAGGVGGFSGGPGAVNGATGWNGYFVDFPLG